MGRKPCCEKAGLKKGTWTSEEDRKLIDFIINYGKCCWRDLPKLAGLSRCGKSCRLRWTNYLRPDLKRGLLSEWEESTVIRLHAQLGNKWSKIASQLPGRTDNEIKNHWNTHIKKKLTTLGTKPDIPTTMAIQDQLSTSSTNEPMNNIRRESTALSSSSMDDDLQSAITQLAKHLDVPDYRNVTDCDDIDAKDSNLLPWSCSSSTNNSSRLEAEEDKSNFWRTEDDDDDQIMRLWVDDIKDCLDMFG